MKRWLLFLFILFPVTSFSWTETECNSAFKINIDIDHSYYELQECWMGTTGGVNAYNASFYDGLEYIEIMYQKIIGGGFWASDYHYQALKKNAVEELVQTRGIGIPKSVDNSFSIVKSKKARFEYKNFTTSDGKGFMGGATRGGIYYTILFFTYNKDVNITEKFIQEWFSSFKLGGIQNPVFTSIKIDNNSIDETLNEVDLKSSSNSSTNSNNNSSSSSGDSFLQMCKNSKLSDLDKDVAMLCLEKMDK